MVQRSVPAPVIEPLAHVIELIVGAAFAHNGLKTRAPSNARKVQIRIDPCCPAARNPESCCFVSEERRSKSLDFDLLVPKDVP